MKSFLGFLCGLALLFALYAAGTGLAALGIPLPASVLGLLLCYIALQSGLLPLRSIASAAGFLLKHMTLLFVPLAVGLMELGAVLAHQVFAILMSVLVSLVVTLLFVGWLGDRLFNSVRKEAE